MTVLSPDGVGIPVKAVRVGIVGLGVGTVEIDEVELGVELGVSASKDVLVVGSSLVLNNVGNNEARPSSGFDVIPAGKIGSGLEGGSAAGGGSGAGGGGGGGGGNGSPS